MPKKKSLFKNARDLLYELSKLVLRSLTDPAVAIILCLTVLGLLTWFISKNHWSDFGLNFFTEMLGVIITVLIIDSIVKKRERKRIQPLKMAEYTDAIRIYSNFVSFWMECYSQSVPLEFPKTVEEFLTENGIGKVTRYLNIDSKPRVAGSWTWMTWIIYNQKQWIESCDKFLSRHNTYSDPELFKAFHDFSEGHFLKNLSIMSTIKLLDSQQGITRFPSMYEHAAMLLEDDYRVLQNLNTRLKSLKIELEDEGIKLDSFIYKFQVLSERTLDSKLTDEVLQKFGKSAILKTK